MILLALSPLALAQNLQVTEEEQQMLGIEVDAVQASSSGATGLLTLQSGFAQQGEWLIKAPLPGIVQELFVKAGDVVAAGDALVSVRSAEFVAVQRDYLKALADWNLQQTAWERDQKLREAGSVSDRRWQETRYAYRIASAEYSGLRAQLEFAGYSEADIERLADTMDVSPDLVLRAPADALVLERRVIQGDHLSGDETLVRLGQPGELVLSGMLSRSAASHLAQGSRIRQIDGEAEAVLVFVASVIDPETQTVQVRAEPTNSSGLVPGQLTRWQVQAGSPVLTLPLGAVVKLSGEDVVYVAVNGGFEPRNVQVSNTGSGHWLVLSGLEGGERVAVSGTAALKGMSIGMGGGDG
jgi:RND family efflux transporter MFP subunit